jgi:hypothetical protein
MRAAYQQRNQPFGNTRLFDLAGFLIFNVSYSPEVKGLPSV